MGKSIFLLLTLVTIIACTSKTADAIRMEER